MPFCCLATSSHSINLTCLGITLKIWARVCLHRDYTKRLLSTTMASPNKESSTTEPPEKQDNLLSKRFVGLEKNIW